MRKKLIIFGLILLLIGSTMLGWILAEKRKQQQKAACYKLKYNSETDDYLRLYNEWLELPPQERTQLPLVLDKHGNTKTKAQLWQEQNERLYADMDKLAAGEMVVHPFADIIYGENWQNELNKYKKRKELNEIVLTASIVSTSMGGLILAWYFLIWTTRHAAKGLSGLKKYSANALKSLRQAKDKKHETADAEDSEQPSQPDKHSEVPMNSERQNPVPVKFGSKTTNKTAQKKKISNELEKIAVLLADEKLVGSDVTQKSRKVRLNTSQQSNPIDNTLKDLSQQVSAIRQYTAYQQDRLTKLQDGYDWNIIRTFCLRIIRCIDNLESRICQINKQDAKATHLEEVRDELIFALESSGIEQFEPEINTYYRGQEKYAEAVKDKQDCDDPKQRGKIARIIRPGYQYFINEENIKVVRPAQVKLFA
ncbi:MAG: nucleotide exchange factor GrpE [Planctomycetota bacterium]|jgi:molecular chaperone GrpE (heat shock protein)